MDKKELIKTLKDIEESSKVINVEGTKETRLIFQDKRAFELFGGMNDGVLNPYNDFTYEWLDSIIMDIVCYLEEDNADLENFDYSDTVESLTSIYNGELLRWVGFADNSYYVDDALKEADIKDFFELLRYSQNRAIEEFIGNVAGIINDLLEED